MIITNRKRITTLHIYNDIEYIGISIWFHFYFSMGSYKYMNKIGKNISQTNGGLIMAMATVTSWVGRFCVEPRLFVSNRAFFVSNRAFLCRTGHFLCQNGLFVSNECHNPCLTSHRRIRRGLVRQMHALWFAKCFSRNHCLRQKLPWCLPLQASAHAVAPLPREQKSSNRHQFDIDPTRKYPIVSYWCRPDSLSG